MTDVKTDNPGGITAADFGPDDGEVGTAKETVEPKAEEKPEDKPVEKTEPTGVSTTEAVETKEEPGPDEGKPKPDETPEDVKKSRAFFQQKAQEETEARKALQDDLAAANAELAAVDPSVNFDAGVTFDEVKPDEPAPAAPADEFAEQPALDVNQLRKDIAGDVVGVLDTRQAQERQHRIDVAYADELKTVQGKYVDFVGKHKVPREVAEAAIAYSQRYVTQAALGAPTKRFELAGEYIQREMTKLAVKEQQKLAKKANAESDDEKVKAAQELAQPSGGGIVAPAPNTPESINKEHADDIMPDDPFG